MMFERANVELTSDYFTYLLIYFVPCIFVVLLYCLGYISVCLWTASWLLLCIGCIVTIKSMKTKTLHYWETEEKS